MANADVPVPAGARFVISQHKDGLGVTMFVYPNDNATELMKDLADVIEEARLLPGWGEPTEAERARNDVRRGAIAARVRARR